MKYILLILSIVALGACSTVQNAARVNPLAVASHGDYDCGVVDYDKGIDLDCFQFPETVSSATAYELAVGDMDKRNRLSSILLKYSADKCTVENAEVYAYEASFNTILSTVVTGLSTAATIVSGDQAKSILSGGAAFANGTGDHINSNIYRNQVTQAITATISGERERLRAVMDSKRTLTHLEYSVDDMVRDANEFHQACSFYRGLELLLTSATEYPRVKEYLDNEKRDREIKQLDQAVEALIDARATATAAELVEINKKITANKTKKAALLSPNPSS